MSEHAPDSGRSLALRALGGEATPRVPVALFTWGFDYTWKVAGLEPWRLACGDHDTWRGAYRSLLARHAPDIICFGNVDSEQLLQRNDPEEIAAEVRRQIRESGAGSPFILSTGSPIPSDVTPAAVDAMIAAAKQQSP